MKIAFIGLGNMGAPMARNLAAAGHKVTGFDVTGVEVEGVGHQEGVPQGLPLRCGQIRETRSRYR